MTDISTLLADLEKLKAARRSGARRIRFGDGVDGYEVEYRTDAELTAAIRQIETEVLGGAGVRNVVIRSPTNKGW